MELPPMEIGRDGRLVGVRVLRLRVWLDVLELDWCRYRLASRLGVTGVSPPMLTHHRQRVVYFTDLPSISECFDAESLARRLTLAEIERFRIEGALVIYFPLADLDVAVPQDGDHPQPLTAGGARQWIAPRNEPFGSDMCLFEVLPSASLSATWEDAGWRFANPRLGDESYWRTKFDQRSPSGSIVPRSKKEFDDLVQDRS